MKDVGGSSPAPRPERGSVKARTRTRPVRLSPADRKALVLLTRTGSHPAQEVRRARILLELDENDRDRHGPVPTNAVIAGRAGVCVDTIVKVTRAYSEHAGDVQVTIRRKKRLTPPVESVVTGEVEARILALACSQPPEGYDRWSLRLLEKHIVLVDDIPDLDHSTIGKVLKKRNFVLT